MAALHHRALLRPSLLLLALAPFIGRAQVPAYLLPTLSSTGEYVHSPTEEVKVVAVSDAGLTLECTQESNSGLQPCTWRERYSVRDGHLVLDAVFVPHVVPPQPAHTEWQMASAVGTANIGPATLDPRWGSYESYIQSVIETVQAAWMRKVALDGLHTAGGGVVTVKFLMNSRGEIVQILGVSENGQAPVSATIPCVQAINLGAPYGDWTDDMVAALGNQQVLSFSFYYQ